MKTWMMFVVITLGAAFAWAGGSMRLSGTVKAVSEDVLEISDGSHVYVLKKSAIQTRLPKDLKAGSLVEVQVDPKGIVETKMAK